MYITLRFALAKLPPSSSLLSQPSKFDIFAAGWNHGEWPSGLRRCSKNRKVPGSNPTRCSAGLRDPTSLRGSWWPSGRKFKKTQWLTSGQWGCPLDNGPKLAVRQPNSSLKKKKSFCSVSSPCTSFNNTKSSSLRFYFFHVSS